MIPGKPGVVQNTAVAQEKPAASVPAENAGVKLAALLSSLKLPQDNLSRSIIAFARFFSLPLDAKLLNAIRREVFGPRRESAALGAAAAEGKGIKLGKKALNEYAAAIEGSIKSFAGERHTAEHRQVNDRDNSSSAEHESSPPSDEGTGTGNSQSGGEGGSFRDGNHQKENPDNQPMQQDQLRRQITEILEKKPLLDLINRIPGKNGRWIVVPFSFSEGGLEFTVSLRLLLKKKFPFINGDEVYERLAADIQVYGAGHPDKKNHWLITLEKAGPERQSRAELSVFSEPVTPTGAESAVSVQRTTADKKQLSEELAKALGISPDRVSVRDRYFLFADSRDDLLLTVDEKV